MDMAVKKLASSPTEETYNELQKVYDLFNERLFDSQLPGALIVMTRRKNTFGYYSPRRFANREGDVTDEIALNQTYFAVRSVEQVLSTMAHEMCHQWQEHFGNKSRRCYHDKEFSDKMEKIGLITSQTGYPGGKRVGEKITHYIQEDGLFIQVCRELLQSSFGIVWYDRFPEPYIIQAPSEADLEDDPPEDTTSASGSDGEQKKKRKKKPIAKFKPAAVSTPAIQSTAALASNIGLSIEEPPMAAAGSDDVTQPSMPLLSPRVTAVLKAPASAEPQGKGGSRVKYTCPSCRVNTWGKAGLKLLCGEEGCNHTAFTAIE